MVLDATARETNFRDSMRKYIFDNVKTVSGYPVFFKQGFTSVFIAEVKENPTLEKWVLCSFGTVRLGTMSDALMEIRPCTRNDVNYFKLAQMVDTILGYLTPGEGDGSTRITLYQSAPPPASWTDIGGILVHDIDVTGDLSADDDTNYRVIAVRLRFASKI